MFEADNEDRDIISGMFRKCMLEQLFASDLRVFDVTDKLDGSLIVNDIPELKSQELERTNSEMSLEHLRHHKLK